MSEPRVYWDSSALIAVCEDESVSALFWGRSDGVARSHAFAEMFSTLTGGRLGYRLKSDDAAKLIGEIAGHLKVEDLLGGELLKVLSEARERGVRGGQVHDLVHAAAAIKASCSCLVTYNVRDFEGLYEELEIEKPESL